MRQFCSACLKVYDFWMRFPEKGRFLLVGGYNTALSYGIFAALAGLGAAAQAALFAAFVLSSLNSFLTQKTFVFGTKGDYCGEYGRCLVVWAISYLLNAALLFVFMDAAGMNPYAGQLCALCIVTVFSFPMLKYGAFRTQRQKGLTSAAARGKLSPAKRRTDGPVNRRALL